MANMKLYALTDFPDDCGRVKYTPQMLDSMIGQLAEFGISRMYYQYYGTRDNEGMWTTEWSHWKTMVETAAIMPNMSKVFVDTCRCHGLEVAGVMRPLEHGHWLELSPYHTRGMQGGIPGIGGKVINPTSFLRAHPDMRIKRRSYDIDPDACNKTIASIKLYKQNNIPTRIRKENIVIYTSPDNSFYKPYTKDFSFELLEENAREDVRISTGSFKQPYGEKTICRKGDPICVIRLSNLYITDQYVSVGVRCDGACPEEERFVNAPVHGIACFEANGKEICASQGCDWWYAMGGTTHLDEGFHFDDGFGAFTEIVLDPDGKEGYFAIAKGKNRYNHGALCECEPLVQKEWFSYLENALNDGYDFIGNRIECHSVMINEPFAYGYNDCIKELYFKRYGRCEEQDMELSKIAKIRGDVYSKLFAEGARRIRAKGKKVYATLNIEMLYDPIPLDRLYAYPMNVEWQWERWLAETQPDEINFRMYQSSPAFLLSDPQCKHMIEVARSYNVPITVERYVTSNIVEEYKLLNSTGWFDALILYETNSLFTPTPNGEVKINDHTAKRDIKSMLAQLQALSKGGELS